LFIKKIMNLRPKEQIALPINLLKKKNQVRTQN